MDIYRPQIMERKKLTTQKRILIGIITISVIGTAAIIGWLTLTRFQFGIALFIAFVIMIAIGAIVGNRNKA